MLDEDSKQRVKELCDQIAKEQNRNRFSLLISELNGILEASGAQRSNDGDGQDGHVQIAAANKTHS